MQLVLSIASRILTLALLWPVSKCPDSGWSRYSDGVGGVQSLDACVALDGSICIELISLIAAQVMQVIKLLNCDTLKSIDSM